MPISDKTKWDEWVNNNQDPFGGACVMVARRAMEILDEDPNEIDTYAIICRADKETGAGGITGFMAGAVAAMVSQCHSRGEEFRRIWNKENQIGNEGEKANESGGVLNPAILNLEVPE